MVKYSDAALDSVFAALADPTRRGILAALANGSSPVSALAQPFDMSLPGFVKHLRVLQDAGLVARAKAGRVVTCELSAEPLRGAAEWIAHYREFWEARLDALARYLDKETQTWPPRPQAPRLKSSAASKRRPRKSGARSRSRK